jgi:hypothetical protein
LVVGATPRRSTSSLDNMDTFVQVPKGITNVPRWEEHCRKIHARAMELVEGKAGVIQTALVLQHLMLSARLEKDKDLLVFQRICGDALSLPVASERQYWAKRALEREDAKIQAVEVRWRKKAIVAATRIAERYRWALAARQRRRASGNVV